MRKHGNEFKVGLFFVLCIVGLVYLTFSTGKVNVKKEGYRIYALFDEVAGLNKKAPVALNGLEVGKVEDIRVVYDGDTTKIKLTLWLAKEAKVRENPVISIKTMGLMGEKYIQIASHEGKEFVAEGSVFDGKPYMDLDVVMEQAQSLTKDIGGLTEEVKKIAVNVNDTVSENKESVNRIMESIEITTRNFEDFSADIKMHPWKILFKTKEEQIRERKVR
ncbi:MAG: MlaD family protein [Candidatus Omnitrophica bacterium]|nr:MlaD family protein [Candidatus Omnitrophota bacterium]